MYMQKLNTPLFSSRVIRTVRQKDGTIWRRREYENTNFSTYERRTCEECMVIKKSGKRKRFDQFRLFCSIYSAIKDEKKPDSGNAVDMARQCFEELLTHIATHPVWTSQEIASITLKLLKEKNFSAALRYRSRYH